METLLVFQPDLGRIFSILHTLHDPLFISNFCCVIFRYQIGKKKREQTLASFFN
jgi:hypothetical protein